MPPLPFDGPSPPWLDIPNALAQIGNAATLQELLGMLQTTLGRDVPQIAQWVAAHNMRDANRLLHALKGFMPIFCTDSLCRQLEQVEMLSKQGPADELAQAYALLAPKLEQLQVELAMYLQISAPL